MVLRSLAHDSPSHGTAPPAPGTRFTGILRVFYDYFTINLSKVIKVCFTTLLSHSVLTYYVYLLA